MKKLSEAKSEKQIKRVLVYGLSGGFGGIEAFVFNMISNSDCKKIQFDILTYYNTIAYQDEYSKMGVGIYTITSKHKNLIRNRVEMHLFFKHHAKEYDVVWCNLGELINIDILKLAQKYKIKKRIIHSHCVASARGKLITKLHYFNRSVIGKIATDFWACSNPAGEWFYNSKILGSDKFKVIRNAVDTQKYAFDRNSREKVRCEFGLQDSFVIGHAGRLSVKEKNTLFLLDIFKEVLNMNSRAKLLIVGDGDDREAIEKRIDELGIRKNSILLGYRQDVERIMNAMDVFLLPSKAEGLGIVLIEAQVSGLPCFTSDNVVPQEVAITELVNFIDLKETADTWAQQIVNFQYTDRCSRTQDIKEAGYEIDTETKRVVELLLS